jgi:hypothetical protein
VLAHILVCFLAYVLWKTLAGWMHRAGLGDAPRTLLEELAQIKSGDVLLPTVSKDGQPNKTIRLGQDVRLTRVGIDQRNAPPSWGDEDYSAGRYPAPSAKKDRHKLTRCSNPCAIPGAPITFERRFSAACPFCKAILKAMSLFPCPL